MLSQVRQIILCLCNVLSAYLVNRVRSRRRCAISVIFLGCLTYKRFSEFELVFGTSCSAPTTGSIITLINDARIAIGKGPVGKRDIRHNSRHLTHLNVQDS